MVLTEAQLQEIAKRVRSIIRAESKGVGDLPVATSLDGLLSLPALKHNAGIPEIVEAPLNLLIGETGATPDLTFIFETIPYGSQPTVSKRGTDKEPVIIVGFPLAENGKKMIPIKTAFGISYKYEGEKDIEARPLFDYADVMPDVSDFSEEGIALLQQPAIDAAKRADDKLLQISQEASTAIANVNTAAGNVEAATKAANDAATLANTAAGQATKAARDANTATGMAVAAASVAEEKAEVANTAAGNAEAATKAANDAATLANTAAGQATKAAGDANTATDLAISAAERANAAAAGAEGLVKGFQSDWNVTDPVEPNYIKNKPEIPTLEAIPTAGTLSYVNADGTTVNFRIGDEVRVLEDGEYVFYRLYDLADGVASWQESGSGMALPVNIYLQGANYYNKSITTIKEGYIQ